MSSQVAEYDDGPDPTWHNPVHYFDGENLSKDDELAGYTDPGWYFFMESWAHVLGPFASEELATIGLEAYTDALNE